MSHRVLVVDDNQLWRGQVESTLRDNRWQVVGEALDGLDAVEQAEALRPDLILLDIAMPKLNGIEAARRIVSKQSKSLILFLSEQSSWAVVDAALGAGGRGYVLKSDASRDLLPAMDALLAGELFVSASLQGSVAAASGRHIAGFYQEDACLVEDYARFAETALRAGRSFIVACVDRRRHLFERRLAAAGFDVDRLARNGRYRRLDVAEVISTIVAGDRIDEGRFRSAISPVVEEAARASLAAGFPVAACGEIAPTLWMAGKAEAAVQLERLWDEVVKDRGLDTLCGYPSTWLRKGDPVLDRICAAHSSIHSR